MASRRLRLSVEVAVTQYYSFRSNSTGLMAEKTSESVSEDVSADIDETELDTGSKKEGPRKRAEKMSENKQKALNGELYFAFTPELMRERTRCSHACHRFNTAGGMSRRRLVELWREYVLKMLRCVLRYVVTSQVKRHNKLQVY